MTIYDNYDAGALYDDARDFLRDYNDEEPTETAIWDEVYSQLKIWWEDEAERLRDFFDGGHWLAVGAVGLWTGSHAAGTIFTSWDDFFERATADCDFWELTDYGGHFALRCSHHDGTNCFEVKRITGRGLALLEKWEDDHNDPRSEQEIHATIWRSNLFSGLPHYARKVYGTEEKRA